MLIAPWLTRSTFQVGPGTFWTHSCFPKRYWKWKHRVSKNWLHFRHRFVTKTFNHLEQPIFQTIEGVAMFFSSNKSGKQWYRCQEKRFAYVTPIFCAVKLRLMLPGQKTVLIQGALKCQFVVFEDTHFTIFQPPTSNLKHLMFWLHSCLVARGSTVQFRSVFTWHLAVTWQNSLMWRVPVLNL